MLRYKLVKLDNHGRLISISNNIPLYMIKTYYIDLWTIVLTRRYKYNKLFCFDTIENATLYYRSLLRYNDNIKLFSCNTIGEQSIRWWTWDGFCNHKYGLGSNDNEQLMSKGTIITDGVKLVEEIPIQFNIDYIPRNALCH